MDAEVIQRPEERRRPAAEFGRVEFEPLGIEAEDGLPARQRHEAAVRALPAAMEPERYAEGRTAHRMAAMPGNHDRTHIEPIREWRREQQL